MTTLEQAMRFTFALSAGLALIAAARVFAVFVGPVFGW